jgi:aspartate/methionine/tyrosine aminotransferase
LIHLLTTYRESGIRVMPDEANKLEGVHHLEIGLTDLPTFPYIVEAAVNAAWQGYTGYTPDVTLDPVAKIPEYKVCAVRAEKIA